MPVWPAGYKGAISLTFDDGLKSHLSVAIPELDARGLLGTFYLYPRGSEDDASDPLSWKAGLSQWLAPHQAGHELGNHSLSHPCSLNVEITWGPKANLLNWTLEQIETDILEAQRRLELVFPSQKATSFAYPCYESTVGRGPNRTSYTPIVARHFVAARARGELRGELANDPRSCDLFHLSSWAVERQPGALMVGLAEQAVALGYWGIFTFHGIQEGHLPVGDTDFVELLDFLARYRDTVWVAPVAAIAGYLQSQGN